MDLIDQIKEANFEVTDEQIEQLAALLASSATAARRADGSYLKILVVACQAQLAKGKKRVAASAVSAVLQEVNDRLYQHVLKGVLTPDIAPEEGLSEEEAKRRRVEQIRRATFARSSKSTLDAFISAMGDVRSLDPGTTSKASLRAYIDQHRGIDPIEQTAHRAQMKIVRTCQALHKRDKHEGRTLLQAIIDQLTEKLEEWTIRDAPKDSAMAQVSAVFNTQDNPRQEIVGTDIFENSLLDVERPWGQVVETHGGVDH